MRLYAICLGLVCLSQTAATAQETLSTAHQSIAGTWIAQVADASGNLQLFEVGTFHPDG